MLKLVVTCLVLTLCGLPAAAGPLNGQQTYDLLFRNGTLDGVQQGAELVYRREVINALNPDAAKRDTGNIVLAFQQGDTPMAHLQFQQDGKHRSLGVFPASVGNPMIMVFYESVVRDMAESAGGSPFYIRNRVKEALIQPSEVEQGEAVIDGQTVQTQTIRLYPFANDPNSDRMFGFGDLEMRVTMSDAVPGWYVSLIAETAGAESQQVVYRSEMRFDHVEPAQ
ncbi:MAG: hypothetical protein COB16_08995 [Rhodobacteraceae bacterium]|nr:MAG: hypothetical protein COB16_08995 [Paracoccaceae bacterium]